MQSACDRRFVISALLGSIASTGGAAMLCGCSVSGGQSGIGEGGANTMSSELTPPPTGATIPRSNSTVVVGLILPLSGAGGTGMIAKAMRQAAEMAIMEHNNADLQLVVKDDRGTPDGARAAATELIRDGAEIILGPLFAKNVTAVAPVARAAPVPVVAFSNDPTVSGGNVYLLSYLTQSEITRVVTYAAAAGHKRYAALVADDAQGRALEPEFRAAVARTGGSVLAIERYGQEANGMVAPIQRLRDVIKASAEEGGRIDAVFIPASEDALPQIAAVVPHLGTEGDTIKLLGTSGWGTSTVAGDGRLAGAWFAAPDPRGWRDFSERFAKTYRTMPPRLASLAYDAVGVVAAFAGEPRGSRFTLANLARPSGFAGADGSFRFAPNGLIERDLAILELKEYGPTVIDVAPSSMQDRPMTAAAVKTVGGFNLQGATP
jgi:ABC-type branched-subunit amino acid transport system substrate-binding protein